MISKVYYTTRLVAPGLKCASIPVEGSFSSLDDKVSWLLPKCSRHNIIGLPATELLVAGGSKHLLWIDIDSRDHDAIEYWLSTTCPFPGGSYVMVPSSTFKWHMYVVTDRPISDEECLGMYRIIVDSIRDDALACDVDRVYGPYNARGIIYIPGASRGRPQLPQHMCAGLTGVYALPSVEARSISLLSDEKIALRNERRRPGSA